jgi:hypothetical protein
MTNMKKNAYIKINLSCLAKHTHSSSWTPYGDHYVKSLDATDTTLSLVPE